MGFNPKLMKSKGVGTPTPVPFIPFPSYPLSLNPPPATKLHRRCPLQRKGDEEELNLLLHNVDVNVTDKNLHNSVIQRYVAPTVSCVATFCVLLFLFIFEVTRNLKLSMKFFFFFLFFLL